MFLQGLRKITVKFRSAKMLCTLFLSLHQTKHIFARGTKQSIMHENNFVAKLWKGAILKVYISIKCNKLAWFSNSYSLYGSFQLYYFVYYLVHDLRRNYHEACFSSRCTCDEVSTNHIQNCASEFLIISSLKFSSCELVFL